jgi:hypothetical protein
VSNQKLVTAIDYVLPWLEMEIDEAYEREPDPDLCEILILFEQWLRNQRDQFVANDGVTA